MATRIKPQWKIRTLLVLTTLIGFSAAWSTHKYRQHHSMATRIEQAGGKIGYAHQRPKPLTLEYTLSISREKEMPNGEIRTVTANAHIPICSIRNLNENEKTWGLFDFENDWAAVHIELPITAFDDQMIAYLKSLPDLKYVSVSGMRDMTPEDEPYGTPSPNPDELTRLRQTNDMLLPTIEVFSYFKQWLKDDIIVYR